MEMILNDRLARTDLGDFRKLAQGLHARYVAGSSVEALRFVEAVVEVVAHAGPDPRVTLHGGTVDVMLVSDDAVHHDDDGVEHVVTWVTERDVDLARRVTRLAAEHAVDARPAEVTVLELALDTADSTAVAPFWAALLTGDPSSRGRGSISDDVRDATGRVPVLWFQRTDAHETPRQRFHLDVFVAPEIAQERIAAAVAAGGVVVDDSEAPSFTVLADADGNRACVCTSLPSAER